MDLQQQQQNGVSHSEWDQPQRNSLESKSKESRTQISHIIESQQHNVINQNLDYAFQDFVNPGTESENNVQGAGYFYQRCKSINSKDGNSHAKKHLQKNQKKKSTSSQTTYEDDANDGLDELSKKEDDDQQSTEKDQSSLNSSSSSINKRILQIALECLSEDDQQMRNDGFNSLDPVNDSFSKVKLNPELHPSLYRDVTYDQEIEDLSQENREILKSLQFYSYDQTGCRQLQKILEEQQNTRFNSILIRRLFSGFKDLMIDQFGNYLSQKVMEVSSDQELEELITYILPSLSQISTNVHGTRSVQTLIDILSRRRSTMEINLLQIIQTLMPQVKELSLNVHGNHVIQAFLVIFKSSNLPQDSDFDGSEEMIKYTEFIFKSCMNNCFQIGSDKHGCCVMQRCLEKGRSSQKLALADVIIDKLSELIEDPFGNYLVQNVLKLNNEYRNGAIFQKISKDFIRLSKMKFSSNVIEKCLTSKQDKNYLEKMLRGESESSQGRVTKDENRISLIVENLIFDSYGNYVLQKMLQVVQDQQLKENILQKIASLSYELQQTKQGVKVLQKLSKLYPKIQTYQVQIHHQYSQEEYQHNQKTKRHSFMSQKSHGYTHTPTINSQNRMNIFLKYPNQQTFSNMSTPSHYASNYSYAGLNQHVNQFGY